MKKTWVFAISILLSGLTGFSQDIPPAPADKAVVYFCRTSSLGFAINFTYFDSATVIAKNSGANYVRYECAPGYHLFWGRSENKDFVEADLDSGKIYFIEVIPQMGALKAGIRLNPVDPATEEKPMKRILKQLSKKEADPVMTSEEQKKGNFDDLIKRGLEKYREEKQKGEQVSRLEKNMYFKGAN